MPVCPPIRTVMSTAAAWCTTAQTSRILRAAPETQLLLQAYAGIVVAARFAGRHSRPGKDGLDDGGPKARGVPRRKHQVIGAQRSPPSTSGRDRRIGQRDERPERLVAQAAPPERGEAVVVFLTDVGHRHGKRPARDGQGICLLQGLGRLSEDVEAMQNPADIRLNVRVGRHHQRATHRRLEEVRSWPSQDNEEQSSYHPT